MMEEQLFQRGNRQYLVRKLDAAVKRKYRLPAGGYPWMTYTGSNNATGSGFVIPALVSQTDKAGRRFLFSSSPWWVDANHAGPGYGYLSLVFFSLLRADYLPEMLFDPGLSYPNMHDMKIRGELRGYNVDLKGADFVFWFQCHSRKIAKNVNYIYTGRTLNHEILNGNVTHFELSIDIADTDRWVCLGSSNEKAQQYGNLPVDELDPVRPIDMGFILAPLDARPVWPADYRAVSPLNIISESVVSVWPLDTDSLPGGTIALFNLEIEYFSQYQVFAVNPA